MAVTEAGLSEVEQLARQVQQSANDLSLCISELNRFGTVIEDADRHMATTLDHVEQLTTSLLPPSEGEPGQSPPLRADTARWRQASVGLDDGVSFEVVVDPEVDDPVSGELARGASSNQPLISLMLGLVGRGDRILDIGSHVGTFSLAAASVGARPLAIEASRSNVELLRASASLNAFDSVMAVHAAAGDAPGSVDFFAHGPWGQVVESGPHTVKVPAVTVAELVDELAWNPVVFVKIDVEGSEMKTLRGMARLLEGPDAPALLYESNGHTLAQYGVEPGDLVGHLEDFGYASYLVDRPRLIRARPDDIQPHTIVDYLAVKRFPMRLAELGWQVLPAMDSTAWIERVAGECRHPEADYRRHAAGVLGRADRALLSDPALRACLAALLEDPDDRVRSAAIASLPSDAADAKEGAP